MFIYQRIDEFSAVRSESAQRAFLVLADQTGITRYVCSDDGCELTFLTLQCRASPGVL